MSSSPSPSSQSPPPPSNSPPSTGSSPPPSSSPPPPATSSPPPAVVNSPPPGTAPPPPSITPPPPAATSPPPLLAPPPVFPPPPTLASPPLIASPPPSSPPVNSTKSPPPAPTRAAPLPQSSPSPPPSANPPTNSPPPPPSVLPPNSTPPAAVSPSPITAPPPLATHPRNASNGSNPATGGHTSPTSNHTTSPVSATDSGGSSDSGGGQSNSGTAVAIAVIVAFLALSFVGLAIWYIRKRRNRFARYETGFIMPDTSPPASSTPSGSYYGNSTLPPPPVLYKSGSTASETGLSGKKLWFSFEELYDITNGFSPQSILGEGGFGCVYKGKLQDGREVAVKQLKDGSGQGEREFKAEVEIISRIHHRHLVSLVGYCISEEHRLLVYDYVPNGTLESHLHGKDKPVMAWTTRLRVAAGSARGLAYLHEDCHPRIIHRDIKSSNILLDNNFEALVADFGLARFAMDTNTHVTTRVMGTFGYLAPEYASSGKLTEKSDVFSFGVVLLELITGKRPVDGTRPLGDESLVELSRPLLTHALASGDFGELPDPRLEGNYNEAEMFRMIEAAAACVRHSAGMRPRMSKVVRVLDGLVDTDINNGVAPGQSGAYHVAQSADIRLFQRMVFGSQEFSSDYSQSNWSRQSDTQTG